MSIIIKSFDPCCPICLDDYKTNDSLCVLKCGHAGHEKCIEQALSVSHKCPLCRNPELSFFTVGFFGDGVAHHERRSFL